MSNDPLRIIRPNIYIPQSVGLEKNLNEPIIETSLSSNNQDQPSEPRKINEKDHSKDPYIQKNGLFVLRGIMLANKEELEKYSAKSAASSDFVETSLQKILDATPEENEEEQEKKKIVTDFLTRLAETEKLIYKDEKNPDPKQSMRILFSPLVVNRERYLDYETVAFEEMTLNKDALKFLEDGIAECIQPERKLYEDFSKLFGLRFLTNSQYVTNLDHSKIREKVINALATDKEKTAQKVYEHYLSIEAKNFSPEQESEVIEILANSNRLSSHLAQTIIYNSPKLLQSMSFGTTFPRIDSIKEAVKLFENSGDNLKKLAMNQVSLIPYELSSEARFGIEIEMKLKGEDQSRSDKSQIQKDLKKYYDLIELGKDGYGTIAEARSLRYGFPLDGQYLQGLFNLANDLNRSTDLALFLSNHIHVNSDFKSRATGQLILFSRDNNSGRTHEMQSLDTCTRYLDFQNPDLYSSFDMSTLVDQMVILEELKHEIITPFTIKEAKEIQAASGLNLNSSVLISQAISSDKSHIVPNILRLAESKRTHIETVCRSHMERDSQLDDTFARYSSYKVPLNKGLIESLKNASESEQIGFTIKARDFDDPLTEKFLLSPEISVACKKKYIEDSVMLSLKADHRLLSLLSDLRQIPNGDQVAEIVCNKIQSSEMSKDKNEILEFTSKYFPAANRKIVANTCNHYRMRESFLRGVTLTEALIGFLEHMKPEDDTSLFPLFKAHMNNEMSIKLLENPKVPLAVKKGLIDDSTGEIE